MLQVSAVEELRREMARWRKAGERIGFVPTMGALHEGHLSLVGIARKKADQIVASIFVNPTQFGPNEDFSLYPRQPEKDAEMLAAAGCDLLFLPDVDTLYPPGHTVYKGRIVVLPAGLVLLRTAVVIGRASCRERV